MILLDTDHRSVLPFSEYVRSVQLRERLQAAPDTRVATTIISYEEVMRGWLAEIHRQRDVHRQLPAYERLQKMVAFFKLWDIVPFDERAADECKRLQQQRVRIGTMDLKIAAIARVHDAQLLSANLRDFREVPGLKVESWLE